MKSVSDKSVDKIKTQILFSKTFFFFNFAVHEIMWEKYCTAEQATDDNMEHAHCMLDITHTLRMCNNFLFSTVTVVT
jgi:hypothetical protein